MAGNTARGVNGRARRGVCGGVCAAGAGVTAGAEDVYVAGADGRALRRGNQRVGRTNLATGERQDERRMAWGKGGRVGHRVGHTV